MPLSVRVLSPMKGAALKCQVPALDETNTGGFRVYPELRVVDAYPHQTQTASLPLNKKDLSHKGKLVDRKVWY